MEGFVKLLGCLNVDLKFYRASLVCVGPSKSLLITLHLYDPHRAEASMKEFHNLKLSLRLVIKYFDSDPGCAVCALEIYNSHDPTISNVVIMGYILTVSTSTPRRMHLHYLPH